MFCILNIPLHGEYLSVCAYLLIILHYHKRQFALLEIQTCDLGPTTVKNNNNGEEEIKLKVV